MADDRVNKWVDAQRTVWDSDQGLRAELITLETPSGDSIGSWPVDLPNLGDAINQAIDLQASELPKGAHRFRLVSYADRARKNQLTELPQTIRGRSGDASAAHAEAIAMQRATAMAISNLENTLGITMRLNEELEKRLGDRTEDFSLTYDKLIQANGENFDQKIRWSEHESKTRRSEQMLEMLTPLVTMAISKFGPMLMRMNANDLANMQKFLADPFKHTAETAAAIPETAAPTEPVKPEVVQNGGPSTEPVSTPNDGLPEPRQGSVSLDAEGGSAGNRERPSAKRSRAVKRTTQSKKGKRR